MLDVKHIYISKCRGGKCDKRAKIGLLNPVTIQPK